MSCLASKNIAIVDHLFCDCGIISKFLQADRNPFLSRDSNVVRIMFDGIHDAIFCCKQINLSINFSTIGKCPSHWKTAIPGWKHWAYYKN